MVVTRFAPSPTGDLHLGGAWTALAAWAFARASGGRALLRIEDIDTPRVVPGSAARITEDLAWLGLHFDGAPIVQSTRTLAYEAALGRLEATGASYLCDCSRKEIAQIASAPHTSGDAIYPGRCRDAHPDREMKRLPAIRLRVPRAAQAVAAFDDLVAGHIEENVAREVGDFVLRRGDGVFAYQLAVAIDDADSGVTHVIRADDLLGSTARQILLLRLLGYAPTAIPTYAHVPLVVAPDGERLAKRTGGLTIRELAGRGLDAKTIVGFLARGLGLVDPHGDEPLGPRVVADRLRPPSEWRRVPWPVPSRLWP